jgi:DNA invertase Pin-like site-specific DNA recombinase
MAISGVAYVRVSSKKQDVTRQIEELNEYALKKGVTIIKNFQDTISASKSLIEERKGFTALKAYLADEKNNTKHLFIHEISRLGRKNHEVQNAIEEFFQMGVNVHFMDLEKSTLDENGDKKLDSSILIGILGSMAENETRLLGDRIRSGLRSSAKNGLAFSDKITGYKKGKDGRPIIDEEQAPLVRRMYELAAEKTSLYFIGKNIESEFGKTINSKTISGIIKNPFYKGERKYLKETILVDKIVSKEIWEAANNFLTSRKNFTKRYNVNTNIVEGKIECYQCGSTMYQVVIEKGRCDMFKCSNKKCSVSVNRPWLYEMIRYVIDKHTRHINDKEFKAEVNKKIKENQQYISDLQSNILETETAQTLNYEMFLKRKVKEKMYEMANQKFEKDLTNIELKLNECKAKNNSYTQALKSKPQHFSDDLKAFKVQIQDVLKTVAVDFKSVTLNVNDMVNYTIPQLNGTKLGWIKRKNKDKKMIFENPFDSKIIKIRNFISDENLEAMVSNHLNENEEEIDAYLGSKE